MIEIYQTKTGFLLPVVDGWYHSDTLVIVRGTNCSSKQEMSILVTLVNVLPLPHDVY